MEERGPNNLYLQLVPDDASAASPRTSNSANRIIDLRQGDVCVHEREKERGEVCSEMRLF